MYNAGWFVGGLQQFKITKFKVFCMFHVLKMLFRLVEKRTAIEDEMEVCVLTAKKI
jgi:hypothetical protein